MRLLKYLYLTSISLAILFISSGCEDGLIFSINDDIQMGQQTAAQIEADPETYPILSESENPEAYAYLQAMTDEILNSGEVKYKDEFPWKLHIIDQDVLNAFATPGGYLYVYTGLIKYLETADDLAGVMGHEVAHSDRRHGSRQMQKQYGVATLAQIIFGSDQNALAGLANNLLSLKFSRDDETEADAYSVRYLGGSGAYACNGAATFFEKLLEQGGTRPPQFLSTHPDPANRVNDINEEANSRGCNTEQGDDNTNGMTYAEFQALFD